jgi:hypothetical protein
MASSRREAQEPRMTPKLMLIMAGAIALGATASSLARVIAT